MTNFEKAKLVFYREKRTIDTIFNGIVPEISNYIDELEKEILRLENMVHELKRRV